MSLFLFLPRWRIAGELILLDNSSSLSPTIYPFNPELDGVSLDDRGHTAHKEKKKRAHYRSANQPTDNKCSCECDDDNYGSWLTNRSPFDFFFFHSLARRSDMKYSKTEEINPSSLFFFFFFFFISRCIANNVLPPRQSLPQLRE